MARSIDDILAEAGEIIDKRAAEGVTKTAAVKEDVGDDIFKLAEAIRRGPELDQVVPASAVNTVIEKIAQAAAVIDTLRNLPAMMKLAEFEDACRKQGMSQEQIGGFIEKKASAFQFKSVFDDMPWLGSSVG